MANMVLLFAFLVIVAVAVGAGYLIGASNRKTPPQDAAIADRDLFIEQLRELAWQHRDVSPELSTIIIDEITTHHRRLPGTN